jgi:hypothetical protein
MRCLTRMGLGLVGLALVIPTAVLADPPASKSSAGKKTRSKQASSQKSHLCARCQWEELRAKGINVPPPPALPTGGLVLPKDHCDRCGAATGTYSVEPLVAPSAPPPPAFAGAPSSSPSTDAPTPPPLVSAAGRGGMPAASPGNTCVACEAAAVGAMPGRAVAGGDVQVPGYAVISGAVPMAEPTPIGVIQGRYAYQNAGAPPMGAAGMPMPGGRPGPGARGPGSGDASVMPSSFTADPYVPKGRNRPHIISHLFGLDAIGRASREVRERRKNETHAAVSYQPQTAQPSELPASMVYGR